MWYMSLWEAYADSNVSLNIGLIYIIYIPVAALSQDQLYSICCGRVVFMEEATYNSQPNSVHTLLKHNMDRQNKKIWRQLVHFHILYVQRMTILLHVHNKYCCVCLHYFKLPKHFFERHFGVYIVFFNWALRVVLNHFIQCVFPLW